MYLPFIVPSQTTSALSKSNNIKDPKGPPTTRYCLEADSDVIGLVVLSTSKSLKGQKIMH